MKKNKFVAVLAAASLSLMLAGQPVNVMNTNNVASAATTTNANALTSSQKALQKVVDSKTTATKINYVVVNNKNVSWTTLKKNAKNLKTALASFEKAGNFVVSDGKKTFKYHITGRTIYDSTNKTYNAKEQVVFYLISYKLSIAENKGNDGKVYVAGVPYKWNTKDAKHTKALIAKVYAAKYSKNQNMGTFTLKSPTRVAQYNTAGTVFAIGDARIAQYQAQLKAKQLKKAQLEAEKAKAAAEKSKAASNKATKAAKKAKADAAAKDKAYKAAQAKVVAAQKAKVAADAKVKAEKDAAAKKAAETAAKKAEDAAKKAAKKDLAAKQKAAKAAKEKATKAKAQADKTAAAAKTATTNAKKANDALAAANKAALTAKAEADRANKEYQAAEKALKAAETKLNNATKAVNAVK